MVMISNIRTVGKTSISTDKGEGMWLGFHTGDEQSELWLSRLCLFDTSGRCTITLISNRVVDGHHHVGLLRQTSLSEPLIKLLNLKIGQGPCGNLDEIHYFYGAKSSLCPQYSAGTHLPQDAQGKCTNALLVCVPMMY